jgi:PST family polysaccharide transporter
MVNDRIGDWVTGRVLGPVALGLYAMSFRLATLPRTGFTFVVSRVLFPTLTSLRGDDRRFRAAFLRGLHWVAALAMPASAGLALLAPEIVAVVLGPRWAGAVTSVRVLAGFALLAALAATTGDVFKATGRSGVIFRVGLVHSAALWTGLWFLAPYGIAHVALAVTFAALLSSSTAFACALGALGIGPGVLARALWAPAVATVVMAAGVAAAGHLALGGGAAALALLTALGVVLYVGTLALLAPADVRELGAAAAALRARRSPQAAAAAGA